MDTNNKGTVVLYTFPENLDASSMCQKNDTKVILAFFFFLVVIDYFKLSLATKLSGRILSFSSLKLGVVSGNHSCIFFSHHNVGCYN